MSEGLIRFNKFCVVLGGYPGVVGLILAVLFWRSPRRC